MDFSTKFVYRFHRKETKKWLTVGPWSILFQNAKAGPNTKGIPFSLPALRCKVDPYQEGKEWDNKVQTEDNKISLHTLCQAKVRRARS